ncbi:MAG TPA: inner membrane CreD family protein [Candidatus Saccharimonadales bacterium]|jgi:inner membrane protein involved in colicin E2 resistance|nr:inner membrane CreD family protein [Candidatus Saccharimonadales bacterium]
MIKRIAAIVFILVCTSVAWAILGSTIFYRTYDQDKVLNKSVSSIWGAPQEQEPVAIGFEWLEEKTSEKEENGKKVARTEKIQRTTPVAVEGSDITAAFHIDYRQKGLLWFSTYRVDFSGTYKFRNATAERQDFVFHLPFPSQKAVYDNVEMTLDGQPLPLSFSGSDASARARVEAGTQGLVRVSYHSQGLDSWRYKFGKEVSQARDFHLLARTDFSGFDFPENSMSPSEKRKTAEGWDLVWNYQNLVSGFDIALKMPQKLQPGPLAGRISYFAPVSLFFFFFLIFILSTLQNLDFHPMNYFFLACAFFAFHLLLAYLADHISIHLAFLLSSIVSIALVVSYLRLVVNLRFALLEAGIAQLIYLVLFSYAFFFEGFTGLTVTIGAIVTLFAVMQVTGRIRWQEKFAGVRTGLPNPVPR